MKSKRQLEERAVLSFTGNPGGSVDRLCGGVVTWFTGCLRNAIGRPDGLPIYAKVTRSFCSILPNRRPAMFTLFAWSGRLPAGDTADMPIAEQARRLRTNSLKSVAGIAN